MQSSNAQTVSGYKNLTPFQIADIVFNALFTFEFVAKVVAFGWKGTGLSAYLQNWWNVGDLVLLIGSLSCASECCVAVVACD